MIQWSQFLGSVVDAYLNARVPIIPHDKLSRGESRPIASEAEDLLAFRMAEALPSATHIFINQTLTRVGTTRLAKKIDAHLKSRDPIVPHKEPSQAESASEVEDLMALKAAEWLRSRDQDFIDQWLARMKHLRVKPDLVITRNENIRALIDLKMDLGYKRDKILDTLEEANGHIEQLRSRKVSLWRKRHCSRSVGHFLEFSSTVKYMFVVISDQNISPKKFAAVEAKAAMLPNVSLFTLVRGFHPNTPGLTREEAVDKAIAHLSDADVTKLEAELIGALA